MSNVVLEMENGKYSMQRAKTKKEASWDGQNHPDAQRYLDQAQKGDIKINGKERKKERIKERMKERKKIQFCQVGLSDDILKTQFLHTNQLIS